MRKLRLSERSFELANRSGPTLRDDYSTASRPASMKHLSSRQNSGRLFWFLISNISIPFGIRAGEYRYRLIYQYMEKVPIRVIDQSVPSDKARHRQVVTRVEQMLALHTSLPSARTPQEKTSVERQIA